ncbi:tyrosine-type recombinase/integrase [Chloroflexota bacterium]
MIRRRDSSHDYIKLNQKEERLTGYVIIQMLCKLGKKLGFWLYAHLVRYGFAITFLENGANTFEVQNALGHSNLEMTCRYSALAYPSMTFIIDSRQPHLETI